MIKNRLDKIFPILNWGKTYNQELVSADLLAALIVTIMLVPQSLAYALVAGLPPVAGIYASILPIILYALFASSNTLAVGPVAVVSLMTAVAVGKIAETGSADYIVAAGLLAMMSGLVLTAMSIFKLGFLANFLSHPVIAGFISASGILIAFSQLKHVLGVSAHGETLIEMAGSLLQVIGDTNLPTVLIGLGALAFLFWSRKGLKPLLQKIGMSDAGAGMAAKTGPVFAIIATILLTWYFNLDEQGVAVVGIIPSGLPPFSAPILDFALARELLGSAILISVIGFVESISVAQTLAAKRAERIDPDQELLGLGAANIGASVSGGFPVTGGFSRSVVNFDAGARTPAAGIFTAIGLLFASLFLTPVLYYLPKATLAATIIVAVLSLIDLGILKRTWRYSKADFSAVLVTILLTLAEGVELGVASGVLLSILIHLYRSSKPHMAIVGRVPGTEHFRNILRHKVETVPSILSMRVDESLYFANARYLENAIYSAVLGNPEIRHFILVCSAINEIDLSALESLEAINQRLKDIGVKFHMSEVKGPVSDRLARCDFPRHLNGQIFLTHHQAVTTLSGEKN